MSLDPYTLCPCGGGDKVKFCCCKDIVPELEKIMRAVEGDQRAAALDQIEKLITANGERLALLALKADLQLVLGGIEAAEETIAKFQKAAPYNPVALALSAIVSASKSEVEAASEKLQRSLEYIDQKMPESVYTAIGIIGRLMLTQGHVLAARGHWILQAGLAGGRDEDPITLLSRLNASPQIPLLLKEDWTLAECPPDVPWAGEFDAAFKSARRGAWLAARESLASLAAKVDEHRAIVKNTAIFHGWLAETEAAVAAWHKYASMEGVDQDEAVEAEALAQLLGNYADEEEMDELTVSFAVPDVDRLMESLLSHKQVSQMNVDLQELVDENEPPPKAVFWLLDRPLPDTGVGLQRDQIPWVVGDLIVHGKRTDREARLELVLLAHDDIEDRKKVATDVLGDLIGEIVSEEKSGSAAVMSEAMTWRWRLPDDTPMDLRNEFLDAQHRDVMLEIWTQLPHAVLDGKTPAEAAQDDAYRIRLLALVLRTELASSESERDFDFNELRERLGIPRAEPISGEGQHVLALTMIQLRRLIVEELEDESLYIAFQRAVLKGLNQVIFRAGREMINRDRLPKGLDKHQVYEAVVNAAPNSDVGLEIVEEAAALAKANGESPARWLLAELSLRLPRLESDHCSRLIQKLQSQHMGEPGVADGLYRLLVAYGVISEDGKFAAGAAAAPDAAPGASAPPAAAPQQAGEGSGLWTPDGPPPASGDEPQKSKLWVPGMD